MKRFLAIIFLSSLILISLERCANPTAITGGERDSIPPTLLQSTPKPQTLNVDRQTFTFTFDEQINADKLQQELLITPTTDNKFTSVIKKNILTLKFEEPFSDSTTYTFNFREGVGDATERNSVENFRYAFSTGPYIDSLSINGIVTSQSNNSRESDFLVGLYNISDTLLTTEVEPYYFYKTDKNGIFSIENIKAGDYLLYTFKDANNNLLFNPADEAYGIYPDTVRLSATTKTDTFNISTVQVNAEKLRRISARPSGNQFQIRISKPIKITALRIDSMYSDKVYPQLSTDRTELLLYNYPNIPFSETDSIQLIYSVRDTLRQTLVDTVYAKFRETQRNPKDLSFSVSNLQYLDKNFMFNIRSSKPLQEIHSSQIDLKVDTLITTNPDTIYFRADEGYSGLYQAQLPYDLELMIDSANSFLPDSISLDIQKSFTLTLSTSSILSVEGDTLPKALSLELAGDKSENSGTINLSIETDKTSFEIRLLNKKREVVRNSFDTKELSYSDLPPDTYSIEVYIDSNNNGTWEVANPWKNTVSEEIYKYPTATELKANWIIDIEDINF